MTVYMADAVALLRYLVDELPDRADGIFTRAEQGVDVVRAPDTQLAEALYQVAHGGVVAGIELQGTPGETFQRLVTNGPVEVATIGVTELTVFSSLLDLYSMHDALFVAAHRAQNSEAIISKDSEFTGETTVWS
jgi:hypothetical protein